MKEHPTKAEYLAEIAKEVARTFDGFVVKQLSDGAVKQWRCSPVPEKHQFHWFTVTCWPCYIVVTGDLGDAVFQVSDRESHLWMMSVGPSRAGGERSLGYPLEKLRTKRPPRFLPGEAARMLADVACHDETGIDRAEVAQICRTLGVDAPEEISDDHARDWPEAVYDATGDPEYISLAYAPDSTDLWCTHAMLWLGAKLAAALPAVPPPAVPPPSSTESEPLITHGDPRRCREDGCGKCFV